MPRQIQDIAYEIAGLWNKCNISGNGNYRQDARPYLHAMFYLVNMNDNYGFDNGRDIVQRFLCNVAGWRGDDARRIKAELNEMLKQCEQCELDKLDICKVCGTKY